MKYKDMGIGKKTSDAYIEDWHDPEYAMDQYHNGSMDYLSEKDNQTHMDVKKIKRAKLAGPY
jgi:hypothetical protein